MSDYRTTASAVVLPAAIPIDEEGAPRWFLLVSSDWDTSVRARVIPIPEGGEVTIGRLDTSTVPVDHESVSRTHSRIVKRGDQVVVEDLDSKNGTFVNGATVRGAIRLAPGDEIGVGPITAVVATTTAMRRRRLVGTVSDLEERLAGEIDRASRTHRTLGLVMLRLVGETDPVTIALDHVAGTLRRMDGLAEYGPDEFAIVLPEADRAATQAVAHRIASEARTVARKRGYGGNTEITAHVGLAVYPEDGAQPGELLSRARAALRAARTGSAGADGVAASIVERAPVDDEVVAVDPVMRRVFDLAKKVADSSANVLVVGETGVGKEVIAEAVHRRSPRAARPFIRVGCASLPEAALEACLFGGAGAGLFDAARGGTLFLDEIGELLPALQARLMRVLEPTGGAADVRLLCATSRDLESEVARGRFRGDLFARLSTFMLPVPPVRDRRSEIGPFANAFARRFAAELQQPVPTFTARAMAALRAHDWPGNVRELRNAIERAVVLQTAGVIDLEHLPDRVRETVRQQAQAGAVPSAAGSPPSLAPGDGVHLDVRQRVAGVEREAVMTALEAVGGNQTRAAQQLGISRFALIRLMEKHGLKARRPGR